MDFHAFVICAYGDSPYLESCVRSLVGQTLVSRIICTTSTPSDYIDRIMARYDIPVIVRDGKSGLQDDWNFALSQADAEFVTLAHQDDMYMRRYTEELWNAYEKWPDMTLFMTDAVTVREPRRPGSFAEEASGSSVLQVRNADTKGSGVPQARDADTKGSGAPRARDADTKGSGAPQARDTEAKESGHSGYLVRFSAKEAVKKFLRLPLRLHGLADREWVKTAALRFGNPVMCPSCAYRKNYLPDPIFHSDMRFALDWDCLTDLAKWPGRFICVEKPLLFYRVHDGAETKACIESHVREKEEQRMFERFWPERTAGMLMHFYKKSYGEYEK